MATRILLITTEPLPLPGHATTGAGLRALSLSEGLTSCGFDVTIGTPSVPGEDPPETKGVFSKVRFFRRPELSQLVQAVDAEVVVLQHWGLAQELPELSVPLVIDLAGPHLLERMYWGSSKFDQDLLEKLAAIRRADFITCSGKYQRHYFYPLLAMAGYDIRKHDIPVIPFSVPPPEWEAGAYGKSPGAVPWREKGSVVYGGAFLAWQDPSDALKVTAEAIAESKTGKLHFYGGSHPVLDASGGAFAELVARLSTSPHVQMHGFQSFDTLLNEYRTYDFALDLMARNPERELAYTTRTMIYLYCGLPVLYNGYSELSQLIRERDCGWICDDMNDFRSLLMRILSGAEDIETKRLNALAVARDFSWDKTIAPLAEFCRNPRLREEKTRVMLSYESREREMRALQSDREVAVSKLQQLEGKFLFRFHRKLTSSSLWLAPFVWLAAWPAAMYLWLRLRPTATRD